MCQIERVSAMCFYQTGDDLLSRLLWDQKIGEVKGVTNRDGGSDEGYDFRCFRFVRRGILLIERGPANRAMLYPTALRPLTLRGLNNRHQFISSCFARTLIYLYCKLFQPDMRLLPVLCITPASGCLQRLPALLARLGSRAGLDTNLKTHLSHGGSTRALIACILRYITIAYLIHACILVQPSLS